MEKNIKDIIHYYIGQPCTYDDTYYNQLGLVGKITTRIILETREPHLSGAVTNVKPHLRRLEDMTEEEARELFELAYCSFTPYEVKISHNGMGYHHSTTVIHETVKCIQFDVYVAHPSIEQHLPFALLQLDEEVNWGKFSELGTVLQDDVTSRQFEQFHYLLTKGFDLWGLIDAGLAIDAKTI